MKITAKQILFNFNKVLTNNYQIRTEQLNGSDHLVVPVVMMVEGVHSGSRGAMLYTAEELSRAPTHWNGVPVTINHPQNQQGGAISANSPDVFVIGRVYNAYMDGDKLKAEAWVDVSLANKTGEDIVGYLTAQRPLDVSVGNYSEELEEEGDFNGEHYIGIAQNIRPDHLALLPGGVGACSWDDGCGIRTNNLNKSKTKREGGLMDANEKQVLVQKRLEELYTNETGFREIGNNIQRQLDAMDNNTKYHMLEEIFTDSIVYRVVENNANGSKYYKQSYSVNDAGEVELINQPAEVRKNVTFETKQEVKFTRNESLIKNKKEMKKTPCAINDLIANANNSWSEDDRVLLEGMTEDQFAKLVPVVAPVVQKAVEAPATLSKEDLEKQIKDILNNESNPEAFIDKFMPKEVAAQMKSGLTMFREQRANLIAKIVENSEFTAERLESWSVEDLTSMHKAVVTEVADYSTTPVVHMKKSENTEGLVSMLNLKAVEAKA